MPSLRPLFLKFFFGKAPTFFFSGEQNQVGAHRRRQTRIKYSLDWHFPPGVNFFPFAGADASEVRAGWAGWLDSQGGMEKG